MKANLIENQENYSKFWFKEKVYEKRIKANSHKPLFLVIDGPPYANGAIHMGHALNKILKDFIVRWKNISGFQSPFLPGWDVHGLPIENKIETETKEFKKLSVTSKREKAFVFAKSQLELQISQLMNIHLLHPLHQYYSTHDRDFIEREYLLLQDLWEKGLIVREYKPVAWSFSSQTALAESEIEYEEEECESIYFFWKIVETNNPELLDVNIILWTTTPYSLESNLAIACHAELKYFLAKDSKGENYLASESFFMRERAFELIKEIKVTDLLKSKYFNNVTKEINNILVADFVLEVRGSGFVHLAPGLGPEDFQVCKKHHILPYCQIDSQGFFSEDVKFPSISKHFYQDASKLVIDFLRELNSLLRIEKIKHKIGKDWRTKKPTFYRATAQWFLNLRELKKELNKAFANKVLSNPDWLFEKLRETVLSREEWCISRQRAWGLPIPVIFKNGKEYGGIKQLKKNISILLSEGLDSWYTKPISYFLCNEIGDNPTAFSKSYDVLDVWFDSGSVFKKYEESIPNKSASIVYLEGGDQLRGWFNSSAILSVADNNSLPFTHLISHGFVLDASREKMSKSKGNVINPVELINKFGIDIFRLWIASVNYSKDISFSDDKLLASQQDYRRIRNILFKFSLGVIEKQAWEEIKLLDYEWIYPENEYIYFSFLKLLRNAEVELNSFNFYRVISYFKDFLELYSTWYLELVKPALYSRSFQDIYRQEIVKLIAVIFKYSLTLFSIFLPQTAEEVYQFWGENKSKASIFLEDWDSSYLSIIFKFEKKDFETRWEYFFKLRDKVLRELDKELGDKTTGEKFQLLKEKELHLSKNEIKYFEAKDLARLLMVSELIEEDSSSLHFLPTNKQKCQRCFCLSSEKELFREHFEDKEYSLCSFCCISLKEYREDHKRAG